MSGIITESMREKWRERIDFLLDNQSALTDWELSFIESVDSVRDLTIKQSFKLGEIFNRVAK